MLSPKQQMCNSSNVYAPVCGGMMWKWEKNNHTTKQIYTDWANHYLEKAKSGKHIQDLQSDVTDGVLLADLIEAVTSQKVPNIILKPKSTSQMLDNIGTCLSFLSALGVSVEGISARDVRDGHLKAILGLFFAISRHKQQQKQQAADRERHMALQQRQKGESKLPSPFPKNGLTSIPLPATATSKRVSTDKSKMVDETDKAQNSVIGCQFKDVSISSSRSTSPANSNIGSPLSGITTPNRGSTNTTVTVGQDKHNSSGKPRLSSSTSVPSAGRTTLRAPGSASNSPSSPLNYSATTVPNGTNKNSMLDKFKFFNSKEKVERKKSGSGVSKRTSSSSGFSSARSERSDSSTSLYSENKPPVPVLTTSVSKEKSTGNTKTTVKTTRNKPIKSTATAIKNLPNASRKEEKPAKVSNGKNTKDIRKKDVKADCKSVPKTPPNTHVPPPGSGIPKPTATVKGTTKTHQSKTSKSPPTPQNRTEEVTLTRQQSVCVAMVSPMLSSRDNEEKNSTNSPNITNKTEQRGSSNNKNNASPVTAVVSSVYQKETVTKKDDKSEMTVSSLVKKDGEEAEDLLMNVKPMQPILYASPYTYLRGLGVPPPQQQTTEVHLSTRTEYHPECTTIPKFANRTLYSSPHDPYRFLQNMKVRNDMENDYMDIDGGMAFPGGYMSDGDILKMGEVPLKESYNGYMSEGGASLYSQQMQERFREAIQQGCEKEFLTDDSLEDLSSMSSTGDITTDDTMSAMNRQQMQGLYARDVKHQLPGPSTHSLVTYPSGRYVVQKEVSGQQEGMRQVSNSQWKHSPGSSAGSSTSQSPVTLRRGKSDLVTVRTSIRNKDNGKRNSIGDDNPSGSSVLSPALNRRLQEACNQNSCLLSKKETPYTLTPSKSPVSPITTKQRMPNSSTRIHAARGVPSSFGYMKRPTSTEQSYSPKNKGENECGRSTQISGVTRTEPQDRNILERPNARVTKLKVSGGTQTASDLLTSDSDYISMRSQLNTKSYSLTPPSASQLAQGVREQLVFSTQSLPKGISASEYASYCDTYYKCGGRSLCKPPVNGPLSGSAAYGNYSEVYDHVPKQPEYYSWPKDSSTISHTNQSSNGLNIIQRLPEAAESMESLNSCSSMQQHPRSGSIGHNRLFPQNDSSNSTNPRFSRSNSIRSTKSERFYPSMHNCSDEEGYYSSPMNANIPVKSSNYNQGLYGHSTTPYGRLPLPNIPLIEDNLHGSSLSLVTTASSLYSTAEGIHAHEVRKLQRELNEAQEKVLTLTSQLSTNAHVVTAFEQSLSNMTTRLQNLTSTAEEKDSELLELRRKIEHLQKQTAEARINNIHLTGSPNGSSMIRQLSTDSVSSINSLSSACSAASQTSHQSVGSSSHANMDSPGTKKKKKGWLRSSFNKAFTRSKKSSNGSTSDMDDLKTDISVLSTVIPNAQTLGDCNHSAMRTSFSSSAICTEKNETNNSLEIEVVSEQTVVELRKQLREKDLVLTDVRLEALSSAHQLESLQETVIQMKSEMENLKQDNERLQHLVMSKSLASSQNSLGPHDNLNRRQSTSDCTAPDVLLCDISDKEGKRISLLVVINRSKYLIGCISVSAKSKWSLLDNLIKKIFKEYIFRIDPVSSLGLSINSIVGYQVGEVVRSLTSENVPKFLPCGYLVGEVNNITITLRGASDAVSGDALVFDTLIPKSIIQRYLSLLTEHRRIILCGPSGTGKSYLANKLAEFMILKAEKEITPDSIATFSVKHKCSKDLHHYLSHIAERCESNVDDVPQVIILDNLHHVESIGEVFNGFLSARHAKGPYIIGTMNQATSATNLQLHHNFRWILCANHMEPVKGFLSRYFRRRLIENEVESGVRMSELGRVLEWMPKVWNHLNKFLETHSSSDVTVGPRLFLSCPVDEIGAQVWFTDLWNYSIIPYLLEAVKEGLQLYGRRTTWEDPTTFIMQSYPWEHTSDYAGHDALLRLRPEDVGYDVQQSYSVPSSTNSIVTSKNDVNGDPLLNMLMCLQEAANYSSPLSTNTK